jgi:DNA-directed RNA polymerase specialized sigma24 family protein
MKYYEGKRNVEIADELGINLSTVSTKLSRAVAKMRAAAGEMSP